MSLDSSWNENVSGKREEIQKTNLMFNNTVFFFENRALYKIMLKNILQLDSSQIILWRMRIACWVPKATNTVRIFHIYGSSTLTMVVRLRINAALSYISVLFGLDTV
jgi:hypothetical protein